MINYNMLLMSDLHCGSPVGLTPPEWEVTRHPKNKKEAKLKKIRRQCWNYLEDELKGIICPILAITGDLVDGRDRRTEGIDQLESDRGVQVEMAIDCIKIIASTIKAKKIILTYGTPYHVGESELWEKYVAKDLNVKIGTHEWVKICDKIIDLKHDIPRGFKALENEKIQNILWADLGDQPKSDLIVRGHTHKFKLVKDAHGIAMSLPALQAMGSRYGSLKCREHVDYGFVGIKIERGRIICEEHLIPIKAQRAKIMEL